MKYNYGVGLVGISFLLTIGGCSTNNSDVKHHSQKTKPVQERPVITTKIVVITPKTSVQRKPDKIKKPYKPQIKRYNQPKPDVRVLTDEEQAAFNKAMVQLEKNRREVDDPYASIPDNSSSSSSNRVEIQKPTRPIKQNSTAVNSLMLQARAEMMVGKYLTAESKIERGLRIEPENPKLWSLLAETHYQQSTYPQAINMAKKAIQFSRDDDLTAKNWRLIKRAGEKSGDTFAVKEANNYIKINP